MVVEYKKKGEKMIRETRTYMDEEGREIHGFYEFDKETLAIKKENVIFKGLFPVMTNMGPLQMACDFPEGYTLEKCFEDFDNIARKTVEEKKKEMQEKSRIITPDQAKKGGLVV